MSQAYTIETCYEGVRYLRDDYLSRGYEFTPDPYRARAVFASLDEARAAFAALGLSGSHARIATGARVVTREETHEGVTGTYTRIIEGRTVVQSAPMGCYTAWEPMARIGELAMI